MCRVCLAQGRITTGKVEAHHIVPLVENKELAYDIDNGITLCVKHHKAADRGEIDRGRLRELAAEPVSPQGPKDKKTDTLNTTVPLKNVKNLRNGN